MFLFIGKGHGNKKAVALLFNLIRMRPDENAIVEFDNNGTLLIGVVLKAWPLCNLFEIETLRADFVALVYGDKVKKAIGKREKGRNIIFKSEGQNPILQRLNKNDVL